MHHLVVVGVPVVDQLLLLRLQLFVGSRESVVGLIGLRLGKRPDT